MTDDPLARNRLEDEESPYLQQHADNPVNWQPWDETALEAARERDRPIFLSIGYSSCHWCHVMAEESFEDETVAEVLNEHFVPIKVDREERPDVDSVYQTLAQIVSGRGGWPLSVWLTPEQKPFHVGTYFPREPRRGMPGFLEVLGKLRAKYTDEREEIEARAEEWTEAIESEVSTTPDSAGAVGDDLLVAAADTAVKRADRTHGGFGSGGPKFPQTGRLRLLLRAHERTGREEFRTVATAALDAMIEGGIYDQLGGGFHRYATDREWVVPHFEKMLYDNAEIPRTLLAGYQVTGEDRYAAVARETFEFLRRELRHPEGGLFSTLDARSAPPDDPEAGDEEGAFYTWTPAAVREAVADEADADLFCDRYGITAAGNFEGETVLTRAASTERLAADHNLDPEAVEDRLETARQQAFDTREERPRPNRDEKILAGWNGLAISALAAGGLVLDSSYAEMAGGALSFCRQHLWDAEAGQLSRRYKDVQPRSGANETASRSGDVRIDGYLEDYAFLARGAFDTYQTTGDVEQLSFALDLAEAMVERFWDADAGTLYFTPAGGESLIARPQELSDQSTPSSAGVAAETLLALDHFRTDDRFADVAAGVLETHAATIERDPLRHASLTLAADRYRNGSAELTIAAEAIPEPWREQLATTYLPARILTRRPPTADGLDAWLGRLGFENAPPIWAGRNARDGRPTVYACRDFACSPPQNDLGAAIDWLRA
ncbi:thioredoxin domain-containing protein [Halapricum hydrolyticum]|uniref:Thioredoxin domain-containing protein n=1 Tax=Halapricum hydrolyticum TaxID=2979991 RepID=A0AAE3I9H9_9EURY|nr:thioredoxin domain-containing protein [Halapricum hydrolyticum]MCU4716459.1 thioredoxin domain-containing protein [Halapricum hydrolyticum]MCU4725937.1 thioredoxin domain-containing protein [Halapricum hydrolyticum]